MKSFISKPYTVQRKQFKMHVRVKGKGIAFADLVSITVLRAARGLANKITQKITPTFPMMAEARPLSRVVAIKAVRVMIIAL